MSATARRERQGGPEGRGRRPGGGGRDGGVGDGGVGVRGSGTDGRNARIGRAGEQAAARYLRARGYRVLDRNWRSPNPSQRGELDLVLRHHGTLVVCEVKTRTGPHLAHPAEAVTAEKAARLRRLAAVWLREHGRVAGRTRSAGFGLWDAIPWLSWAVGRAGRAGSDANASFGPAELRIDVVAVRLGPCEPYPVRAIDHLQGVA